MAGAVSLCEPVVACCERDSRLARAARARRSGCLVGGCAVCGTSGARAIGCMDRGAQERSLWCLRALGRSRVAALLEQAAPEYLGLQFGTFHRRDARQDGGCGAAVCPRCSGLVAEPANLEA